MLIFTACGVTVIFTVFTAGAKSSVAAALIVIIALPAPFTLTFPAASTVATVISELLYDNVPLLR